MHDPPPEPCVAWHDLNLRMGAGALLPTSGHGEYRLAANTMEEDGMTVTNDELLGEAVPADALITALGLKEAVTSPTVRAFMLGQAQPSGGHLDFTDENGNPRRMVIAMRSVHGPVLMQGLQPRRLLGEGAAKIARQLLNDSAGVSTGMDTSPGADEQQRGEVSNIHRRTYSQSASPRAAL